MKIKLKLKDVFQFFELFPFMWWLVAFYLYICFQIHTLKLILCLFFFANFSCAVCYYGFRNQIEIVKQFIGRAVTLIIWPTMLYMCFFFIHLEVLNHSGNGDGFYSSAFQSQLIGNSLHNATMPRQVAYGAILTLKNYKTGGGYLHSHYHLYPKGAGARQQQVI